ncbi:adenylosuccinate synthetase [Hugenholtzia roseola]|uniref:adenylosuccinate synthetase n=1 Tax=Hugenholtzia roseola TaxID=1002 RepID=UPI000427F734|nr:adenylosuccinate synthetase [Hugenholtzia roseola]
MSQEDIFKRHIFLVIGLGFGDEGKGKTVDGVAYGCTTFGIPYQDQVVIRFNGGQQAGHTVVLEDGKRHVFSQFGAATLRGVPTYWSKYCSIFPNSFLNEYNALRHLGVAPRIFWDRRCPITTHYDQLYNRLIETRRGRNRHGSCGLGFGATMERHETSPYLLFAQDLETPIFLAHKLKTLRHYYSEKLRRLSDPDLSNLAAEFENYNHQAADAHFLEQVAHIQRLVKEGVVGFIDEASFVQKPFEAWIFEGAQGVLLDREYGLFPHVTRSHTTSRNVCALLEEWLKLAPFKIETLGFEYVTRAYQTRHGAGLLPFEDPNFVEKYQLGQVENETNQFNEFQEHFRKAPLSLQTLRYALRCESSDNQRLIRRCTPYLKPDSFIYSNLILTCLDQFPNLERLPLHTDTGLEWVSLDKMEELLLELFEAEGYQNCKMRTTFSPAHQEPD